MDNLNSNSNSNSINPNEAKKLIKENKFDVLVDVRTVPEYQSGHISNAVHIPLDKIEKKIISKYPDNNTKILLYCRSGGRANCALQILNSLGYTNVYYVYDGGYFDLI